MIGFCEPASPLHFRHETPFFPTADGQRAASVSFASKYPARFVQSRVARPSPPAVARVIRRHSTTCCGATVPSSSRRQHPTGTGPDRLIRVRIVRSSAYAALLWRCLYSGQSSALSSATKRAGFGLEGFSDARPSDRPRLQHPSRFRLSIFDDEPAASSVSMGGRPTAHPEDPVCATVSPAAAILKTDSWICLAQDPQIWLDRCRPDSSRERTPGGVEASDVVVSRRKRTVFVDATQSVIDAAAGSRPRQAKRKRTMPHQLDKLLSSFAESDAPTFAVRDQLAAVR